MKPRRFIRLFQKRFVPLVESGAKRQTMRPVPKRRPQPGDIIECRYWSGKPYRSKQVAFAEGRVTRFSWVLIDSFDLYLDLTMVGRTQGSLARQAWSWVSSGGRKLTEGERNDFARADGFADFAEMQAWFLEAHDLPFGGCLIEWKPIRRKKGGAL